MSDRTDRSGARETRRGLESVVQLYLSRPRPRTFAWPEPEAESAPADVASGAAPAEARGEEPLARRAFEAEKSPAIETPGFIPGAPGFVPGAAGFIPGAAGFVPEAVDVVPGAPRFVHDVPDVPGALGDTPEPVRDADAIAREIEERLDARLAAVSAIPFVDWEAVDEGPAPVEDAAAEDLKLPEDVELDPIEAAPDAVLSGISLDIVAEARGGEPGAYDVFAEIVPGALPQPGDEAFAGTEDDDVFSEDDLPPQEIGSEALRAELAFKLEEHLDAGRDETEIFFEEDAHEAMTDVLPSTTTVEEIFDLVERSLSLGSLSGVEAPASPGSTEEAAWEILPEETPQPEASASAPADAAPAAEPPHAEAPDPMESAHALDTEFAAVDIAGEILEPDLALHAPRVALFLSTLPPRLRRRLLDRLAAPLVTAGRHVLFLEPDPADSDTGNLIEEALGLDTAVWRRSLGASPREILLMRPAQREQLFGALAVEERRSDLVLFGVGLPESIVCPRMLPLADTIVVGLTRQESSLYEAYRALRGLPERRPGLSPYAVAIATSADEAAVLLTRFRQIAKDFLRISVLDGGWLELASMPHELPGYGTAAAAAEAELRDPSKPGIAPDLLALMTAPREEASDGDRSGPRVRAHDGRPERAFFERLADWFGPGALRQ